MQDECTTQWSQTRDLEVLPENTQDLNGNVKGPKGVGLKILKQVMY